MMTRRWDGRADGLNDRSIDRSIDRFLFGVVYPATLSSSSLRTLHSTLSSSVAASAVRSAKMLPFLLYFTLLLSQHLYSRLSERGAYSAAGEGGARVLRRLPQARSLCAGVLAVPLRGGAPVLHATGPSEAPADCQPTQPHAPAAVSKKLESNSSSLIVSDELLRLR